jgi:hypothetical protein
MHVAHVEAKRNAYRVLMGQSEGKRSLLRPGSVWEDNIKLDLREIVWNGFFWLLVGTSGGLL